MYAANNGEQSMVDYALCFLWLNIFLLRHFILMLFVAYNVIKQRKVNRKIQKALEILQLLPKKINSDAMQLLILFYTKSDDAMCVLFNLQETLALFFLSRSRILYSGFQLISNLFKLLKYFNSTSKPTKSLVPFCSSITE